MDIEFLNDADLAYFRASLMDEARRIELTLAQVDAELGLGPRHGCSECSRYFPDDHAFFNKCGGGRENGLHYVCKACQSLIKARYLERVKDGA
jgi:hypothetical protein